MKRNPYYQLKYIENIPYLLAFGQANADFRKDMRLNEVSAFLWEHLEETENADALISLCMEHFQYSAKDYDAVKDGIELFIANLYKTRGILPNSEEPIMLPFFKALEIAGLCCRLYGLPQAFPKEFDTFTATKESFDKQLTQNIYLHLEPPAFTKNGKVLLRCKELVVMETTQHFVLLCPASDSLQEIRLSKDGRTAHIYAGADFSKKALDDISYALRMAFIYFAQCCGMLVIHSASILYKGKAWLFSAPSGTGKSTHASLWQQLYNTAIINGDLNLVTLENKLPVVRGIPWCGTSGIYDIRTYPLGGVIFLKQGTKNAVSHLSKENEILYLLHRCISPSWTSIMQNENLDIVRQLVPHILLCQYECTMEKDAPTILKEDIDNYLNSYHFC